MKMTGKAIAKATNPIRQAWLSRARRGHAGPRVLANGIQKAGTHLLDRCLDRLPGMIAYHRGVYVLDMPGMLARERGLAAMPGGAYVTAHLRYSVEAESRVNSLGLKHILIVRDPRDVAVSLARFTVRKRRHPFHDAFLALPDDDARLMAAIRGIPDCPFESALRMFETHLPWGEHGALIVRFEDLVGPEGGGSMERQERAIRAIIGHLDLPIPDTQIPEVARQVFWTGSPTFRRGQAGGWRNVLSPAHLDAFRELAGDVLERLGYEET